MLDAATIKAVCSIVTWRASETQIPDAVVDAVHTPLHYFYYIHPTRLP